MLIKKITNKISTLLLILKSAIEIRTISQKNFKYLKNGRYKYNYFGKMCVYNNHNSSLRFIDKISKNRISKDNPITKFLLKAINLFFGLSISNDDSVLFNGDLLMKTIQGNIKIFNFDESLVLTKIKNNNKLESLQNTTDYFRGFYLLTVIEYDQINGIVIDRLINYKPFNQWSNEDRSRVIETIFKGHISQSKEINEVKIEYTTGLELLEKTNQLKEWKTIYDLIIKKMNYNNLDKNLPIIKCHGDLNFNNTLLSDNQVYLIDFDDPTQSVFFYDIINLLFVDALYLDDYSLLASYFNGDFDNYLVELFGSYHLEFKRENKFDYILIYILSRIISYEVEVNFENTLFVLPKYEHVINVLIKVYHIPLTNYDSVKYLV